jgi:multimeric flavodoxin WrbA
MLLESNKKGNIFHAINMVGNELKTYGIELEILHIGYKMIPDLTACGKCVLNKNEKCIIKTDDRTNIYRK